MSQLILLPPFQVGVNSYEYKRLYRIEEQDQQSGTR